MGLLKCITLLRQIIVRIIIDNVTHQHMSINNT